MKFYLEPTFWVLATASLTACGSVAFMRTIGRIHAISILIVWACATGTVFLLYGTFPALLTAACSLLVGALLMIASLTWSGIRSMPNRRFEDR